LKIGEELPAGLPAASTVAVLMMPVRQSAFMHALQLAGKMTLI
jgi:hypothetical protein